MKDHLKNFETTESKYEIIEQPSFICPLLESILLELDSKDNNKTKKRKTKELIEKTREEIIKLRKWGEQWKLRAIALQYKLDN